MWVLSAFRHLVQNGFLLRMKAPTTEIQQQKCRNYSIVSEFLNRRRVIKSKLSKLPNFEQKTVCELLKSDKGNWGKETAYKCAATGFRLSFDEVEQLSENFGAALYKCGLRKGDVVAIILPNCPQYAPILLGMLETGIIASPIHTAISVDTLTTMMNIINPKAVVTFPENLDNMLHLKVCTTIQAIILVGRLKQGYLNFLEMIGSVPLGMEFIHGKYLRTEEEVALLTWSAGPRGHPLATSLTHRNLVAQVLQLTQKKATLCRRGVETFVNMTPVSYAQSAILYILVSMLIGAKVITVPAVNPRLFVRAIRENKPTCLHLYPPQIKMLQLHSALRKTDLADTHTIMCTGPVMPDPEIVKDILCKADKEIFFQGAYGIPEASYCMVTSSNSEIFSGSVGYLISNTVAKIFDLSTGMSMPANKEGEICLKGPQIFKGYWDDRIGAGGSAKATMPGRWFHTGDIGYYDKNKSFHVTEHKDDLIFCHNAVIWPRRLENFVRQLKSVQDVAVTGVQDPSEGQIPKIFIVKRNPFMSHHDVVEHLKGSDNEDFRKATVQVQFMKFIPRTYTGKVNKRELLSCCSC